MATIEEVREQFEIHEAHVREIQRLPDERTPDGSAAEIFDILAADGKRWWVLADPLAFYPQFWPTWEGGLCGGFPSPDWPSLSEALVLYEKRRAYMSGLVSQLKQFSRETGVPLVPIHLSREVSDNDARPSEIARATRLAMEGAKRAKARRRDS